MITLEFRGLTAFDVKTLGPAAWFELSGSEIRVAPQGIIRAHHRPPYWEIDQRKYLTFVSSSRCVITLKAAGRTEHATFGPFTGIRVHDGSLFADDTIYARFDDQSMVWVSSKAVGGWELVVLSPS